MEDDIEQKVLEVDEQHYNQLWKLIHYLEAELITKGMSLKELDKIRKAAFGEKEVR